MCKSEVETAKLTATSGNLDYIGLLFQLEFGGHPLIWLEQTLTYRLVAERKPSLLGCIESQNTSIAFSHTRR